MTVIQEIVCRQTSLRNAIFVLVVLFIALCGSTGVFVCEWFNKPKKSRMEKAVWWLGLVLMLLMFVYACVYYVQAYNNTHTEYIVDIDEGFNFQEFHNKWEIVSQEGEYYRIREK